MAALDSEVVTVTTPLVSTTIVFSDGMVSRPKLLQILDGL